MITEYEESNIFDKSFNFSTNYKPNSLIRMKLEYESTEYFIDSNFLNINQGSISNTCQK